MSGGGASIRATLDAWREDQGDRLDPMRFRVIDALERRATRHHGELRRVLDERLLLLVTAYAEELARATVRSLPASDATSDAPSRPLGELLEYIARQTSSRQGHVAAFDSTHGSPLRPVLPALEGFRQTWSAVRSDSRLRQSLAFVPTNAGPLNSAALVHRSMALMRELSPGYLRHFLAYVDDLSWLEQLGGSAGSRPVAGTASSKKRARKKPGA